MNFKSGLTLTISLLIYFFTAAQQLEEVRCGTEALDEIHKTQDHDYMIFRRAQENTVIEESYENKSGGLIQIPVVVHVLYRLDIQNISDAQIQSQIDVLNKDFRANNWDTMLVPSVWKEIVADCEIEFVLANRSRR